MARVSERRPYRLRPYWAAAVVLAAVVLLAACASRSATPPERLHHPALAAAQSRPPAASPKAFPVAGPCPRTHLPQLPAGSGCATRTVADFDGDGKPDQFIVYAHPLASDGSAEAWHILILLDDGNGNVRSADLPATDWPGNMGVVTAFDANHDGRAEALVLIGAGASVDDTRLYELWDTRILPVRSAGKPFDFQVGGVVLEGSGGGCQQVHGEPLVYTTGYWSGAGTTPSSRWHWQRTWFRWDGVGDLRLSKVRTEHGFTTERGTERYRQFTCLEKHLRDQTVPKVVY